MKWILDLLIEKWEKKDKEDEWEPEPLHIQDHYPPEVVEDEKDDDKSEKRVIIIDI